MNNIHSSSIFQALGSCQPSLQVPPLLPRRGWPVGSPPLLLPLCWMSGGILAVIKPLTFCLGSRNGKFDVLEPLRPLCVPGEAGAGLGWRQRSWNVALQSNPHVWVRLGNSNRAGRDQICPAAIHNYIPIAETSPGTRTVMLQVLYGWERGPGGTQQSQRDFRC